MDRVERTAFGILLECLVGVLVSGRAPHRNCIGNSIIVLYDVF